MIPSPNLEEFLVTGLQGAPMYSPFLIIDLYWDPNLDSNETCDSAFLAPG